jgi:hypothetical protein
MREPGDFMDVDHNSDLAMGDWLRYGKTKGWR